MKATPMTCRQALMVLIGEPDNTAGDDLRAARLHTSRCPRCNAVYRPSDAAILGTDSGHPPAVTTSLRLGLLAVAVVQLVLAIPWLVGKSLLPDHHVAVAHLTRDGALGLMIAALALVTVWRPRYVHSTKLIALVVLALQIGGALADREMLNLNTTFELVHLLVITIVVGLYATAADLNRRATPHALPKSRTLQPASASPGPP